MSWEWGEKKQKRGAESKEKAESNEERGEIRVEREQFEEQWKRRHYRREWSQGTQNKISKYLKDETWETKEEGGQRYSTKVYFSWIILLGQNCAEILPDSNFVFLSFNIHSFFLYKLAF